MGVEPRGFHVRNCINNLLPQSKRFFDLTKSEKDIMQPSSRSHQRGYSSIGSEKVREHICTKEGFGCGNPEEGSQSNVWPPEELLPGFCAFMEDFFWVLQLEPIFIALVRS